MTSYIVEFYFQEIKTQEKNIIKAEKLIKEYKQKLSLEKQKLESLHLPINQLQKLPNDILILVWEKTLHQFLYMKNFDKIDMLILTIGFKKCNFKNSLINSKDYQKHCISKINSPNFYYQKAYHLFHTITKKKYMNHYIYYSDYYDYFVLFGNDKSIKNRYKFIKRLADKSNIKNRWKQICEIINYNYNQ